MTKPKPRLGSRLQQNDISGPTRKTSCDHSSRNQWDQLFEKTVNSQQHPKVCPCGREPKQARLTQANTCIVYINKYTHESMNTLYVCMYVCMYVRMYVCMYVYVCICM